MLNKVAAKFLWAARALAVACVFAVSAACGAQPTPPAAPAKPAPAAPASLSALVSHAPGAREPAAPAPAAPAPTAEPAATVPDATATPTRRFHVLIPDAGATTPEELVFLSTVVARVRLVSADAGVRNYPSEDGRGPAPVLAFRFRVIEYLKGSGGNELTVRVIAEDTSPRDYYEISASPTPDANAALRTAKDRLAERDTRWDGLEAVVFLSPSPLANESGVYEFSTRRLSTVGLYDYAITSDYGNSYFPNRAWLPGGAPTGDAGKSLANSASAPSEPRYFTSAPAVQTGESITNSLSPASSSAPSISLSSLKALVAANADMMAKGEDIPGYEECVREKFEADALYKKSTFEVSFVERRIPSGQPAGHRLAELYARPPAAYYDRQWFAGPDADLFISRIANDPDNDPSTGYAWEYVTYRPVPEGEYNVFVNSQISEWVPCDYNPEALMNTTGVTIIATAPASALHEAFFDPASIGSGGAVGADASNGVLKPTSFTFGGADAALDSVKWQSQAVEMRLSPHNRLANHHADFIALDGSVSLRLDFDDATETGEGDSRALSWAVCAQPWQAGDLLMLRISESPSDLSGVSRDGDCAAATATAVPDTPTPTIVLDTPTATPVPDTPTPTVAPDTATPVPDTPTPTVAPTLELATATPTHAPDTPTATPVPNTPTPTATTIPDTPTPVPDTPTPTPEPDTPTPTPEPNTPAPAG